VWWGTSVVSATWEAIGRRIKVLVKSKIQGEMTQTLYAHMSKIKLKKKSKIYQVLVACTCNPSYLEGRDQEDRGSRSAQANSSREPPPPK
jgi:hypothetical protein